MTDTIAESVIEYLGNLQEVGRFEFLTGRDRAAVVDVKTGVIVEADPAFPRGELLMCERKNGSRSLIETRKLVQRVLARQALKRSISDGGRIREHYHNVVDSFHRKTGFDPKF